MANEFKKSDNVAIVSGAKNFEPVKMKEKESNNTKLQLSVNGFEEVNSASLVFYASKGSSTSNSLDPKE